MAADRRDAGLPRKRFLITPAMLDTREARVRVRRTVPNVCDLHGDFSDHHEQHDHARDLRSPLVVLVDALVGATYGPYRGCGLMSHQNWVRFGRALHR